MEASNTETHWVPPEGYKPMTSDYNLKKPFPLVDAMDFTKDELKSQFEIDDDDFNYWLKDSTLVIAFNSQEDYEETAYILFEKKGLFYEVHAFHCSCSGFEGQFKPDRLPEGTREIAKYLEMTKWRFLDLSHNTDPAFPRCADAIDRLIAYFTPKERKQND